MLQVSNWLFYKLHAARYYVIEWGIVSVIFKCSAGNIWHRIFRRPDSKLHTHKGMCVLLNENKRVFSMIIDSFHRGSPISQEEHVIDTPNSVYEF